MADDPTPTPTVTVAEPIVREVTEHGVFTGSLAAVHSVDVKARVTGYLVKLPFKEGGDVRKGDLLAEIDPRPYQAQLDAAKADVALNEAKYELAKTERERAEAVRKANPGAISDKALDQHKAEEAAALAAVNAAKAKQESYQLNLSFTKVHSPIDGQAGRFDTTYGNLVTENETLLTTVVSQDPIYAYFDVDSRTYRRLVSSGLPSLESKKVPVKLALQGDKSFPHDGVVDFASNVINASTGTITVRAELKNPANDKGKRAFLPGMFVRVKLPLGLPGEAVLVTDQVIGTDQGLKYVYVVDADDTIQYRRVKLGALQDDGLRVVLEGVKAGDRVVTSGLQLVRPKMKVKVETAKMPTPASSASDTPPQQSATDGDANPD